MGTPIKHPLVKLIVGFIFKEDKAYDKAKKLLERRFGSLDFESQTLAFNHTDYYEKELGKGLKRRFLSFKKLIRLSNLPKIKLLTNRIEQKLTTGRRRQVNIDPGCLTQAKVLLATTKDQKHRVYLKSGIYAEVTLFYQDKTFKTWDWTYPDYKTAEYIEIFNKIRAIYVRQI